MRRIMFFVLVTLSIIGAAGCKSNSSPEDEAGLIGTRVEEISRLEG